MCIQVNVFQSLECKRQNKLAFSRLVEWSNDVEFPFNRVLGALNVLYPNSIVTFENYSEK